MGEFPGFPGGGYDFRYEDVGPVLGGMIVRDVNGVPRAGVLPSKPELLTAGSGWTVQVAPFVAVRVDGRKVLIGGSDEVVSVDVAPAPAANARLDVVYSLPAHVAEGEPLQAVAVATGLPAAVPAKPAIPEGAVELGTYRAAAGQSSAAQGTVSNTFAQTAMAGGVIPFRTTGERDSFVAVPGQLGSVNGALYRRDADAWVSALGVARIFPVRFGTRNVPGSSAVQVEYTFPPGTFSQTPRIVATPFGTGAAGVGCTITNDTANGFTLNLTNSASIARSVGANVIAMI